MSRKVNRNHRKSFTLAAPAATEVLLAGDFTEWEKQPIALQKNFQGTWTATVKVTPGPHRYRFLVDGEWQDDPACPERVANVFGTQDCICQVG